MTMYCRHHHILVYQFRHFQHHSGPTSSPLFISETSAATSANSLSNKKRKSDIIDLYSKPNELWEAKNYYEFVRTHKEFAQCKLCACGGLDKKFKHNNSTSNMTQQLANAHNVTNENPTGNEWKFQDVLLSIEVLSSHTAENIQNILANILNRWHISDKVFVATTDNGANMKKAIHYYLAYHI
ncbi:7752_t:CDS:2 [Ambispora leptoticha]|uniref:7752_t:CDS:1 n=1 Tax=Ambispora leptoticha TaxID=144679 RepID=A0A9N8WA51_9GLOM|nr:7752_t:CDS:2 [Ambispora leptoticha]